MDNQNYNLNYQANYNPAPQAQASKRPAINAMVLGLVALTLSCIPLFGSIPAIILAIVSLVKIGKLKEQNIPMTYGFLKGGKISSIIALILAGIITLLYVFIIIESVSSYSYYY